MLTFSRFTHLPFLLRILVFSPCIFADSVLSNELSLDMALQKVLVNSPPIKANEAKVEVARRLAIPAGALPDPQLSLSLDNLPIEGRDAYRIDRDFMTMQSVKLMQEIPNAKKRKAQVAMAQAEVELAQTDLRKTRVQLLTITAQTWIQLYTTERQLDILNQQIKENHLLQAAFKSGLSTNKTTALDVLSAEQEAITLASMQDSLIAQQRSTRAQLHQWIGEDAYHTLTGSLPHWPIVPEKILSTIDHHADLSSLNAMKRSLAAEVARNRAEKKVDWNLEMGYSHRAEQFGDMMTLGVSIPLPIFTGSRQSPRIAAAEARQLAFAAEAETMTREHRTALEETINEYHRLEKALLRQKTALVPLIKQKLELNLTYWRNNKINLSELIKTRNELLQAEFDQWELAKQFAQVSAKLHFIAEEIASTPTPDAPGVTQ